MAIPLKYNIRNLFVRKITTGLTVLGIARNQVPLIVTLPGIEKDIDGNPLASSELVVMLNLKKIDGGASNVTLRGISDKSPLLRPQFKLIEGRMFSPGLSEVVVSRSISERFKDCS